MELTTERQIQTAVREGWIRQLVDRYSPEHRREAATLMVAHRRADDPVTRRLAWERALGLATRPFRRPNA